MYFPIAAIGTWELIIVVVAGCLLMSALSGRRKRGGIFRKLVICGLVVLGVLWFVNSGRSRRGPQVIIHERGGRAAERDLWDSDFESADDLGDRIGRRAERFAERLESRIKREIDRGSRGRGFPLTSEAEATVYVKLSPDRIRAEDVEEDDLAIALLEMVARLLEQTPEQKAELKDIEQISIGEDDEDAVRLHDVARVSRRRDFGLSDWRDSIIKISFDSRPRRIFDLDDLFDEIEDAGDSDSMRQGWSAVLTDEAIYIHLESKFELPEAGIPDRALADKSDDAEKSQPAAADTAESVTAEDTQKQPSAADTAAAAEPSESTEEPTAEAPVEEATQVAAESAAAKPDTNSENNATEEADEPAAAEVPAATEVVETDEGTAEEAPAEAKLVTQTPSQDTETQKTQEETILEEIENGDTAVTETRSRSDVRGRSGGRQRDEPPVRSVWPPMVDEKPVWVDAPVEGLGTDGIYYLVRNTKAMATKANCIAALNRLLVTTTREYAIAEFGRRQAQSIDVPVARLRNVVRECWIEPVRLDELGVNVTYYLLHARFGFDVQARDEIVAAWQAEQMKDRLWYTGSAAAIALALVGSVFGYLKLDTASRGYYSGRLKLATGAVVLVLLTLAVALVVG